ncbi:uncharacterized protein [Montipora capricornis]|uniref:uncharacterized protein n=1 Tax=Montipora capricornis TaxID=246305 RepID=UPI0035F15599
MSKTGVAFSGGGVRSAALCSGVLRRLLHKKIVPDYLSCVSGGGYVGTAYLDWKYRNENRDDPRWHEEFFDNMRKRIGLLCDWRNPLQGCFDTLVLLTLNIAVAIFLSSVNYFGFAFPTAYLIDYFFGNVMRATFTCPSLKTHNFTSSAISENPEVSQLFNMTETVECVQKFGPDKYFVFITFAFLFIIFLIFYIVKRVAGPSLRPLAKILFNLTGFVFAMTFFPWFIEEFVVVTPLWLNALILFLSVFLWLGIPPLREKASLIIIVYLYAYAVKWRVYKTAILYVVYTERRFAFLLWISGVLIWLNPLLGMFQRNAIHIYYRWRLQRAFYSPESTRTAGCSGITWNDMFPFCTCFEPTSESLNRGLTLDDLVGIAPEYICNVTVHEWRLKDSPREPSFALFTMAPSLLERVDNTSGEDQFKNRLHPRDIKLSQAMATSAAVVSFHMGEYETYVDQVQSLQIMLGLGMGNSIVAEPKGSHEGCQITILSILIQLFLVFPIIVFPIIPVLGGSEFEVWETRAVAFFLVFAGVLTFIAVLPTGGENPGCWQKFVRWCIIHIYHVRFIREVYKVVNVGPTPPPVLHLSDGGHFENLGILPLLKRRLEKIVVVDGGAPSEEGPAKDLIMALQKGREILRCSFTGLTGQDVYKDIRVKVIDKPPGKQPRSYRFKVEYHELTENEDEKVGEGEILYILPRHPGQGLPWEGRKWDEIIDEIKIDIEADRWGSGPEMDAHEVDRLTCCCCECCHCYALKLLSEPWCGVFPNHGTANQFFTPAMFSAYHREGYRACMEARASEFLEV